MGAVPVFFKVNVSFIMTAPREVMFKLPSAVTARGVDSALAGWRDRAKKSVNRTINGVSLFKPNITVIPQPEFYLPIWVNAI